MDVYSEQKKEHKNKCISINTQLKFRFIEAK